jgi:enoyl-CoA hydratase/carnithine racemase
MVLTSRTIDSREAFDIGLVAKVVPYDQLPEEVKELAERISAQGPIALRYAKEAINSGMDLALPQGLRLEADLYFLIQTTDDRMEGIAAFREKRPPRFKGK